ncbi:MAG: C4-dicarboxylate ABC transporter, partial [Proteobacteria bacterium]|nr:C4-dicarboxylate ABC transporter [Pseudomonadota bacterium]
HNGGILEREEFAPNQLRPLVTIALPAYQVQLAGARPARSARDLEGLRIRTTGGTADLTMRLLKSVPVRMAESGIRESLSRGTLDGILLPYQGSDAYAPGKLLKSGTEGPGFGHVMFTYAIGQLKWRTLPEKVRRILDEAGEQVTREGCRRLEDQEAAATGRARASGMQAIPFDAADKGVLNEAFARVSQDWAQDLDRRGKPGTAVLKAFTAAVAASR